jgi:type I restriction enzyme S subunit
MAAERVTTTIAELLARSGGSIKTGPFGTTLKASEYSSVGVPLISVGEIGHGVFRIHEATPRVPPAVTLRLAEYLLQEGDIVFGRKGAVDRSARISSEQHGWFLGSDGIRLRLPGTTDSRFMAFQLQSPVLRKWILQHATGTTMPSLNQDVIGRIPISLPPLAEQRAIAGILGTLDDKIELNRKTNETLEALARALFKSWFVDFDPVRAKAAGRAPAGMDAETAALFPSEFVDSDLGPIPKGWRRTTLGETSKLVMGQSPPGDTYNEIGDGMPFFQGSTDFGFRFPSRRIFCTAPTRLAAAGDTLVSVRAPVGTLNMAIETCALGRGVAAVRHRSDSRSFTYYLLHSMQAAFEPYDAEGTVFGSINKAAFEGLRHVEPAPMLVEAFASQAEPIDKRIEALTTESATLARTRDELLPRLLSGAIEVGAVADSGGEG